jgi:hypothetical protein
VPFIHSLALVVGLRLSNNDHWDKMVFTVYMLCRLRLLYSFFFLAFGISIIFLHDQGIRKGSPRQQAEAFPQAHLLCVARNVTLSVYPVSRGVHQADDPYLPKFVTCLAGDVCVSILFIYYSYLICI